MRFRAKREPRPIPKGGVSGTLMYGFLGRRLEGSVRETHGRARGSSRNIRHEQSVGHSLLKIPDHPCFAAGDRDREYFAMIANEVRKSVLVSSLHATEL